MEGQEKMQEHKETKKVQSDSKKQTNESVGPQHVASKVSEHISKLAGVEKIEGFHIKNLFEEIFRKHSAEEIEEYFIVGTQLTTPGIQDVDTSWPRPWVFFRTFISSIVVYALFVLSWYEFENINLVPGMIIVGSFAVPISTLIFFVEVNVRKNISLYQIIRMIFIGGILSLVISLIFFQISNSLNMGWLGASVAGLVEEPGKLVALLLVINIRKYHYILNGLLLGAAIGTGFAAFESAGYALYAGLNSDSMTSSIMLRGLLSPFAHIAWTGMCGAALWKVKGDKTFDFSMLKDMRFLRIFIIAVVMHMIWNSPLELPFWGKNIILGVIAWSIIFALIQEGLKQIQQEKLSGHINDASKDVLPESDKK